MTEKDTIFAVMLDVTTDIQMESQLSRILRCFDENEKPQDCLGAISISVNVEVLHRWQKKIRSVFKFNCGQKWLV